PGAYRDPKARLAALRPEPVPAQGRGAGAPAGGATVSRDGLINPSTLRAAARRTCLPYKGETSTSRPAAPAPRDPRGGLATESMRDRRALQKASSPASGAQVPGRKYT